MPTSLKLTVKFDPQRTSIFGINFEFADAYLSKTTRQRITYTTLRVQGVLCGSPYGFVPLVSLSAHKITLFRLFFVLLWRLWTFVFMPAMSKSSIFSKFVVWVVNTMLRRQNLWVESFFCLLIWFKCAPWLNLDDSKYVYLLWWSQM